MAIGGDRGSRPRGTYTIGEIAELYHIGTDSIRYYERKGLLEPVRGENGYRYYSAQSIWRMNVIRSLRDLGFPVERIGAYLRDRTLENTEEMLREEQRMIQDRLRELRKLRASVDQQLELLEYVKGLTYETVVRRTLPDRRAFQILRPHSLDEETDLLMKQLAERSNGRVEVVGSNWMAELISPEEGGSLFQGTLMFDRRGDVTVPGGDYLSVFYRGPTDSRRHLDQIRRYAGERGLTLLPPFLEVIWVDVHTVTDPAEFVSEVQARVAPEKEECHESAGAL